MKLFSQNGRSYGAGKFELQIDGWPSSAYVKSIEGGYPKQNISDEPIGGEVQHIKHGTSVEVDPITIQVGMAHADFLMQWISASWSRRFARHNGSLVHADFDCKAVLEHEFMGALIEETTFPALDASSKEAGFLTLKLRPETVKIKNGDGHAVGGAIAKRQKLWQTAAFRFKLDGLDTAHVNKIDAFTIKQGIKPVATGKGRFPELEPTSVSFPDLKVQMSLAYSKSVYKWYENVVIHGMKDSKSEKNGSIEFLATNRKDVLMRIDLFGVGIKGYNVPKSEANQDQIKRCTFDLYVTRMELGGDVRYGLE